MQDGFLIVRYARFCRLDENGRCTLSAEDHECVAAYRVSEILSMEQVLSVDDLHQQDDRFLQDCKYIKSVENSIVAVTRDDVREEGTYTLFHVGLSVEEICAEIQAIERGETIAPQTIKSPHIHIRAETKDDHDIIVSKTC